MQKFILTRITQMIGVMIAVSMIVFIMTNVIGNPVYLLLPPEASMEQIKAVEEQLGLTDPLPQQYMRFLSDVAKGEFGKSYKYHISPLLIIKSKLPATLEIVIVSVLLTILIAVPLGVFSGAYHKTKLSKIIMTGSIAGISLPTFWLGMVLIYLFSLKLVWLPVAGRGEMGHIFGIETSLVTIDGLKHIILPAITLSLGNIATIIRLVRAGMQENMRQDYVKFARAKGVSNRNVLFGHALKNTMIPVITMFGLMIGDLIAFTTITETIFSWPGMGKLLIDAITSLDRPIISAYLLFVAAMFVIINFTVDIIYTLIDPRIELN